MLAIKRSGMIFPVLEARKTHTDTSFTAEDFPAPSRILTVYGCDWSPDGTRFVLGYSNSPYITIYNATTNPYTPISNLISFSATP